MSRLKILRPPGLLASLPASELTKFVPSGSLYEISELRDHPISKELRLVLNIVESACASKKLRLLLVVRPEIFTHGVSLRWLQDRVNGISDHLCISDGSVVKVIPKFRNHLFLYRMASLAYVRSFEVLSGFVPEVFASMNSQVNTCLSFEVAGKVVRPPSVVLQIYGRTRVSGSNGCFAFVWHQSIKRSVELTIGTRCRMTDIMRSFSEVMYIQISEAACMDQQFMGCVRTVIGACYSSSLARCVVLNFNKRGRSESEELTVVRMVHEMIRKSMIEAQLLAAHRVFLVPDHLSYDSVCGKGKHIDLLVHSSFDFWSLPVDYYSAFRKRFVAGVNAAGTKAAALIDLLEAGMGESVKVMRCSSLSAEKIRSKRQPNLVVQAKGNNAGTFRKKSK